MQDWSGALSNFLKAIELSPDNPDYHNSAGYAYQYIGNEEEAKYHFQTAVHFDGGCG